MLQARITADIWSCCTARTRATQQHLPDIWKTTQRGVWSCHRLKSPEAEQLLNIRNGRCKAVSTTSQRPDFFCSHLFSSCYVLHFYRGNQNPTDGSDCMILSISTSTHSTSKQSSLSQGLHPSGHQHPDNIGITLWLCDLHSCNVLSTLRSCLYCLGLNFCVYKDLTNTHIQNVNI